MYKFPEQFAHIRLKPTLLSLAGFVLSILLFFRIQISNGFTVIFGDRYDGDIEVVLMEHWYNVLMGQEHWNLPNYFFPYPDVLGYDEAFMLYGLIASLFRLSGFDAFVSAELTHITVKAIGYMGMYLFMRIALKARPAISVIAAIIFTISCNSLMQASHGQLLAVAFAPLCGLLLFLSFEALISDHPLELAVWGCIFSAFYGIWLLTSFYMAWFFGYYVICFSIVILFLLSRRQWRDLFSSVRHSYIAIGIVALFFVVSTIPFLTVYLPKAHETGMHPISEAFGYSQTPLDLVNVGAGNLLFGKIYAQIHSWLRPELPLFSEHTTGFPPFLLVLFLGGLIASWRRDDTTSSLLVRAIAVTAVVTWISILNFNGFSLWHVVYAIIPGAKAVRVLARYQIFLSAPFVVVGVWYLSLMSVRLRRRIFTGVCVFMVLEELTTGAPVSLDAVAENHRLSLIPHAPFPCRSFFVAGARPGKLFGPAVDGIVSHNIDAMLVASRDHLPTINGVGSFYPPDWNFAYPEKDDYLRRVTAYLEVHGLESVCALDLLRLHWTP